MPVEYHYKVRFEVYKVFSSCYRCAGHQRMTGDVFVSSAKEKPASTEAGREVEYYLDYQAALSCSIIS